jgi:hypothetical protein
VAVILDEGEQVDVGVDGKQSKPEPPPDPVRAPKGWRWDRNTKEWVPRQRAAKDEGDVADDEPAATRPDSAWATGPDGVERRDGGDRGDPDNPDYTELTEEERNDIEAILEFATAPARLFALKDPYCGQVIDDNWDLIRERSLPIIARSPKLVEWMTRAGGARDWVLFGAALYPVGKAVFQHHITKSVHDEGDDDGDELGRFPA